MKTCSTRIQFRVVLGLLFYAHLFSAKAAEVVRPPEAQYEKREKHDRNGAGIFYMGREIAQVMGHEGAEWLERPTREREEHTQQMVELLKFREGEIVADIGAGTGYVSEKIARVIGTNGLVYGTDIQQEMIELFDKKMKAKGVTNVKGLLGAIDDAKLPPASVDSIIMVDVYHEFDHPWEMTRSMIAGLKPGGRIIFVEFRAEDPKVPIKQVHKMSEAQVKKEMAIHPELEHAETISTLPWQHLIIFRKKN
jgi:ubiquinone/menaquinone biosynthesis C-methylase UbiE